MSNPLPVATGMRSHLPDIFSKIYSSYNTDPLPKSALTFNVNAPAVVSLFIRGTTATLKMTRPPIRRGNPDTFRAGPAVSKEVSMSLAISSYQDLTSHTQKQGIPSIGQLAPIDLAGTVLPSFEQWLRDSFTEFLPVALITWSVEVPVDVAPIAALALVDT